MVSTSKHQLLITLFIAIIFLIMLDYGLESIGLRFGFRVGFFLFEIRTLIVGFISSILAIFLSFRIILKTEYRTNLQREIFLGFSTSILFLLFLSVYVTALYGGTYIFGYWLREWGVGIFFSSLIGSLAGFLLGGNRLQRMPPPLPPPPPPETPIVPSVPRPVSTERGGGWIVLLIFVGAVLGYVVGYIVWVAFGQIQIAMGIVFPYAALLPPPLIYQIAWTVGGAFALPLKTLTKLLD